MLNHTIAYSFNSACIVFAWPRLHLAESSVAGPLHQASSWMWLENTHTGHAAGLKPELCSWAAHQVYISLSIHLLLFLMSFSYFAMSWASNLSVPSYPSSDYFASYFLEKPKPVRNEHPSAPALRSIHLYAVGPGPPTFPPVTIE